MIINNPNMTSVILMNILALVKVFLEVNSHDISKLTCQSVSD